MYKVKRNDICVCVNSDYDYYLQNVQVVSIKYDNDNINSVKVKAPILSSSLCGNPTFRFYEQIISWDNFKTDFKVLNFKD